MKAPDYREAACCGNCYFYGAKMFSCTKNGGKANMLHVCADFATRLEIEGEL